MPSVSNFAIISDQIDRQELAVILRELDAVLAKGVAGDVVEFGCYVGTTSLFLQRSLAGARPKTLHVYDSFAGLPAKQPADQSPAGEQFKAGELVATKAEFIKHFKHAGLPLPVIHKGWFEDLTSRDVPAVICFAFLDGDFYGSILASLRLIWPRLHSGAVVVVDDYHTEALPGVAQALKEWSRDHPFELKVEASLAIVTRSSAPVNGASGATLLR
jgi:O-methyltransferase